MAVFPLVPLDCNGRTHFWQRRRIGAKYHGSSLTRISRLRHAQCVISRQAEPTETHSAPTTRRRYHCVCCDILHAHNVHFDVRTRGEETRVHTKLLYGQGVRSS